MNRNQLVWYQGKYQDQYHNQEFDEDQYHEHSDAAISDQDTSPDKTEDELKDKVY
jgi:hypothetical protein